jgi:acetyltransferase-like isoleucine patch superfamily enzyme
MNLLQHIYLDIRVYIKDYLLRKRLLSTKAVRVKKHFSIPVGADKKIGYYTFIDSGVVFGPSFDSMGMFCSVGQDAIIGPNHHEMDLISTSSAIYKFSTPLDFIRDKRIADSYKIKSSHNCRKTRVGNDVWVGARAIILSGVTIGDGAVVGAGTIVTKDIPPYAIVAGNPAMIIRYRFSEQVIKKILHANVYSREQDKLFFVMSSFSSKELNDNNIDAFISKLMSLS